MNEKYWGRLALTQKRIRDVFAGGEKYGRSIGYARGHEDGFREGWNEAKEFPDSKDGTEAHLLQRQLIGKDDLIFQLQRGKASANAQTTIARKKLAVQLMAAELLCGAV